ncbi:hypothetical protein H5T51_05845 [Candidatus Bathyarchaeota archaeon]|nr:hypothetical protein [Candidatus Bathyarchaeota archaeon]
MNAKRPVYVRGRLLGIAVLVATQLFIGIIHLCSGAAMLSGVFPSSSLVYSLYTLAYGFLTLVFTWMLWLGMRVGWIGTVAIAFFIIVADSLAMLGVFNGLDIPWNAGFGEIPYSLLILAYLLQSHVRAKYKV